MSTYNSDEVSSRRALRARTWRSTLAVLGLLAALGFAWGVSGGVADAAARHPLKRIVCGGVKGGASGWLTYPTGGYVGGGCGAGIDYIDTPTAGQSTYSFGRTDGGKYVFWAWIPTVHATATLDFYLVAGPVQSYKFAVKFTVHEQLAHRWIRLNFATHRASSTCRVHYDMLSGCTGIPISVVALTGAFHGQMGLDAIKALPPGRRP